MQGDRRTAEKKKEQQSILNSEKFHKEADAERRNKKGKDKDGVLVQGPEQVKRKLKEYVEGLYQAKSRPRRLGQDTDDEGEEENGSEFLKEEILAAIRDMKNNKAK